MDWFSFQFSDFSFSFLSILLEGIPFLLLGSLIAGAIDVFVPAERLTRLMPKNTGAAIGLGALMGAAIPMCECGSVVVIRRFMKKGLPISSAVAYMLGAPIVNPIVALSTYAAFRGQNPELMTALRVGIGFAVAVAVAFLVRFIPRERLLQKRMIDELPNRRRTAFRVSSAPAGSLDDIDRPRRPWLRVVGSATSDFLDVAFFFVIGAAAAALFNTAINQRVIDPLATSAFGSITAMMLLAGILALCSTTDAFVAASFIQFPFSAKLAFLTFGPVFDVKLFFLYGMVFRRKFVVGLAIGLFVLIALACLRLSALQI